MTDEEISRQIEERLACIPQRIHQRIATAIAPLAQQLSDTHATMIQIREMVEELRDAERITQPPPDRPETQPEQ